MIYKSKQFWNERFDTKEYIYGVEPNAFLKQIIDNVPPGKILLPAEGEGRNAVYCAKKGFIVDCFDQSEVAKNKALKLANNENVNINYLVSDIEDFDYKINEYDYIGIFFLHLSKTQSENFYKLLIKSLKPGGKIIIEVFSKIIYENQTAGPKDLSLRYNIEDFKEYLKSFNFIVFEQKDVDLNEGSRHQGKSNVIRIFAEKTI
ncbi:MAG: class I SAM-dependent methyltransferase [Marinilabiliales bacterium]